MIEEPSLDLKSKYKVKTTAWLAKLTEVFESNALLFLDKIHPHLILSLMGAARIILALDPDGTALVQSMKFAWSDCEMPRTLRCAMAGAKAAFHLPEHVVSF